MLNNREIALAIWACIAIVWAATKLKREDVLAVGRALLEPKILIPLAGLGAWAYAEVQLGARLGLWQSAQMKDTIIWSATALALFARFERVAKAEHYLRRTAAEAVALTVVLGALTDTFVLPLLAELLLVPALFTLGAISAVSSTNPELRPVKRLADATLTCAGCFVVAWAVLSVITRWHSLDTADLARTLALPVWLTLALIPYVYLVGLLATYEGAFLHINWDSRGRPRRNRWRAKAALVLAFRTRAHDLDQFGGNWSTELVEMQTLRQALAVANRVGDSHRRQAVG